jgi:hypothetical protein
VAWLRSSVRLAVECAPTSWTLVSAEHSRDRAPRLVAAESFDDGPASLTEKLRQFRVREHLPSEAVLVLWPVPGDDGVAALDSRSRGAVTLPKAKVIRDRVAPFVRAGGQVRDVLLPHEAAVRLVSHARWTSTCLLLMQATVACLAVIEEERVQASYLSWEPMRPVESESGRLLARYQFAARLVPYVREWVGVAPEARVAVCGRFPDLRSMMVPIVEELDREVDVLDATLVGQPQDEITDRSEISGCQLAWALAAGQEQGGNAEPRDRVS